MPALSIVLKSPVNVEANPSATPTFSHKISKASLLYVLKATSQAAVCVCVCVCVFRLKTRVSKVASSLGYISKNETALNSPLLLRPKHLYSSTRGPLSNTKGTFLGTFQHKFKSEIQFEWTTQQTRQEHEAPLLRRRRRRLWRRRRRRGRRRGSPRGRRTSRSRAEAIAPSCEGSRRREKKGIIFIKTESARSRETLLP